MANREAGIAEGEHGFYLQFDIPAAERGAVEALENKAAGIELVAVPQAAAGEESITATVFVPERSVDSTAKKSTPIAMRKRRQGVPKTKT
ncbi:hypothetical protein [Rhizobium leguminosarum]|uniref:hypothetical protein n=1 Tax=Rhizobium leguminosarum TaxID=384 RepID=UPI0028C471DE|nr:hypothetical protein [Rhizobium leguminosarum]